MLLTSYTDQTRNSGSMKSIVYMTPLMPMPSAIYLKTEQEQLQAFYKAYAATDLVLLSTHMQAFYKAQCKRD